MTDAALRIQIYIKYSILLTESQAKVRAGARHSSDCSEPKRMQSGYIF